MHHTGEGNLTRLNLDPDLFLCFTRGRGYDGLISIQMARRDAVFTVPKACVETTEQQDLILSKEQ
jgi:hypothetical protein